MILKNSYQSNPHTFPKSIHLHIFLIFIISMTMSSIKFPVKLWSHHVRKSRGTKGEYEKERICRGRLRWPFACAYMLHTHLLLLRSQDLFKQLKLIASIYEVNHVRSSQPSIIPAHNGFSRFL